MTAIMMAAGTVTASAFESAQIVVTEGDDGLLDGTGSGDLYRGFISGLFGSISPASVNGNSIIELVRIDSYALNALISSRVRIALNGVYSQDEFDHVIIEGQTYDTAQAGFAGGNVWTWSSPSHANLDAEFFY